MKALLRGPLLGLLALLGAVPATGALPDDGAAAAWLRGGDQEYAGTPYHFLGRWEMQLVFEVKPESGAALELLWGSKNDPRAAAITVNGQALTLAGGGDYAGFRWLRLPLPDGLPGERYEVLLRAGAGKAAFLAEVRLTVPGGDPQRPDLQQASHRAKLTLKPAPGAGFAGEAFPEMRRIWDTPVPTAPGSVDEARGEAALVLAERNARQASEALFRCRRFVDGWLAHADPTTGLIPRNLQVDYWNGRDAAADNYPFMVLTAAITDRPLFEGRMLEMLRTETRLTCRVDRLPDDYSFSQRGWRREKADLETLVFEGAEYVKDGLLPITEWLGPSPWSERAIGIIDDIWKHAAVETPAGKLPTLNFEVNGDLLQACSRLFWLTGERKYLDWAIRLGDYYLLGDHHPTRDLEALSLGDHSCEVINGLSELYVACASAAPEKREAYRRPLHELYDRLLEIGRNEHSLVYLRVNNRTGEHSAELTDNWGYNYDGLYTVFLLDGTTAYRDAVRAALGSLKEHYTGKGGMCQSNTADGYADSLEGAINLLNREPVDSAAEWIDSEIRTMWSRQRPDGVIEGWHGDGNSARTSLMYALWKTQGVTVEPWRADVRVGAVREGKTLWLRLNTDQAWEGKLSFDTPRHRLHLHLPLDYPRINQFPEWFTVSPEDRCEVRDAITGARSTRTGKDLIAGVPVSLPAAGELRWELKPVKGQ
jgi:hypothetical protein